TAVASRTQRPTSVPVSGGVETRRPVSRSRYMNRASDVIVAESVQLLLQQGERAPRLVLLIEEAPAHLDALAQRDDVLGAVVVSVADLAKQLRRQDVVGGLAHGPPSGDHYWDVESQLSLEPVAPADPEAAPQRLSQLILEELVGLGGVALVRLHRRVEGGLERHEADGVLRLEVLSLEGLAVPRELHDVGAVVGLVREVLGRLVVVRCPDEPDVGRNRQLRPAVRQQA